jgi:hypothetical protein
MKINKLLLFVFLTSISYNSFAQCIITSLTASPGACVPATNIYTVSGSITFSNAPSIGTLTVSDCHGGMQVFNAPFTSPQAYSISSIPADGVSCNITAVFSSDTICTSTINYTAPASCAPVSISEIENKLVKIYPNPSKGIVTMDVKPSHKSELKIFSPTGKVVEEFTVRTNSQLILNTQNLSSGIYFYVLYTNNEISERGKLVID